MALIYIVEDDESIREIESIALKNSNYIVSAFENAKNFTRSWTNSYRTLYCLM